MTKKNNKQLTLIKKTKTDYGGVLFKIRAGRAQRRPLDSKNSMHLTLRSSKAVGDLSFKKPKNSKKILFYVAKFSRKCGVQIISLANVGNHLHFHIKLSKISIYKPFIKALTGAIALSVSGRSRWQTDKSKLKFWDYRPFTRVVYGFKAFLNLKNYIEVNQLEGLGVSREKAYVLVQKNRFSTA
ncbi:hypothetical protein K2X05_13695 [bacterium]|nr:hypothetical protein [bacterium]